MAAAWPDAYRANWVISLNNLANRLSDLGRYERALSWAKQAETIWRELAAARPDAYWANWARFLGNYSDVLIKAGKPKDALPSPRHSA